MYGQNIYKLKFLFINDFQKSQIYLLMKEPATLLEEKKGLSNYS